MSRDAFAEDARPDGQAAAEAIWREAAEALARLAGASHMRNPEARQRARDARFWCDGIMIALESGAAPSGKIAERLEWVRLALVLLREHVRLREPAPGLLPEYLARGTFRPIQWTPVRRRPRVRYAFNWSPP